MKASPEIREIAAFLNAGVDARMVKAEWLGEKIIRSREAHLSAVLQILVEAEFAGISLVDHPPSLPSNS